MNCVDDGMIGESMRLLIYGAGVIGSLYAAYFSEAGFDVTIFARGNRFVQLNKFGLKYLKNKHVEIADVSITKKLENEDCYDFIFLTVRSEQAEDALAQLKMNNSQTIVTMINTIESYKMWENICGKGRILPAFPGAGGSIKDGILDAALTPRIIQPTTFGEIDGRKTNRQMILAKIFKRSHIPYQIVSNMYNWQISHLGMVVPIADAYYMSNNPVDVYRDKKIMNKTAKQIKLNFKILSKKKMLLPFKFNLFILCPLPLLSIGLRFVFKSDFGDKFMYQHSMNATDEMRDLHIKFYHYMKN